MSRGIYTRVCDASIEQLQIKYYNYANIEIAQNNQTEPNFIEIIETDSEDGERCII